MSKAVAEHPEGLQELTILCGTGQPCARVYQSESYAAAGACDGKVISFAAVVLLSQRRENAYDCDLTDSLQHD